MIDLSVDRDDLLWYSALKKGYISPLMHEGHQLMLEAMGALTKSDSFSNN